MSVSTSANHASFSMAHLARVAHPSLVNTLNWMKIPKSITRKRYNYVGALCVLKQSYDSHRARHINGQQRISVQMKSGS